MKIKKRKEIKDQEEVIKKNKEKKDKFSSKLFNDLSENEKWELLEVVAKELGLIK